ESAHAPGGLRLDGLERDAILAALRKTGGHHQQAADLLGISRRTLSRKLKTYGPDFKGEPAYAYGTSLDG
ncbi:MAG TPA: helix-turn-helix domain-containing protein, partial [Bryobacteraceae bacterium]